MSMFSRLQQPRSMGVLLHVGHYAALNGGDFDSIDANMQQLIKEPLDLNGAVQDALRGVRSS